jgi:hypothetical protein
MVKLIEINNSKNTNSSGFKLSPMDDEENNNGMSMPHGINFATGLMSMAFPKGQRDLIQNIPQVLSHHQAGIPEKIEQGLGQYAPYAMAGGPTLAGSTAAAGAFGAKEFQPGQHGFIDRKLGLSPGGRVRNSAEDMLINVLLHGAGSGISKLFGRENKIPEQDMTFKNNHEFSPGESGFTNEPFKAPEFINEQRNNPLSDKISEELHYSIAGKRSLDESSKELASDTRETYSKLHGSHQKRYNDIFEKPTEDENIYTGEPFKVKERRIEDSEYLNENKGSNLKGSNLETVHDIFESNPTIENGHKLQSEMGSEIGYLKDQKSKGLLDESGRIRLRQLSKGREALKRDIRGTLESIDPKLRNQYDAVTQS